MEIHIRHITKNGYDLALNDKESWLMEIFKNLFPDKNVELPSITGNLHLENYDGNINLSGQIQFKHTPLCARCGDELTIKESIPLQAHIVPLKKMDGEPLRDGEEEELELTGDDLDFAFYEGDEVEVDSIINDEIALAIPYSHYCPDSTACKMRHAEILKSKVDTGDPRWSILKGFKSS